MDILGGGGGEGVVCVVTVEFDSHCCSNCVNKHNKDIACAKDGQVDSLI